MVVGCWSRRILKWALRLGAAAFVFALAAVPTAYFGLPALARTGWAKARVERALSRATNAKVLIGGMEFTWSSGLSLRDVNLPRATWDGVDCSVRVPEIKVRRLRRRPAPVLVSPEIRILERGEAAAAPASRSCSWRLDRVDVRQGRLTYASPDFSGSLVCEKIDGRLSISRRKGTFRLGATRLSAQVNGGTVSGSGVWTRAPKSLSVQLNLSGTGVAANDLVARFVRPAAPLLGAGPALGSVSFSLKGSGSGRDGSELLRTAKGEGEVALRGVSTQGEDLVLREVDSRFVLLEGKLLQPSLEVRFSGQETWRLMGWTSADGRLDYAVRSSTGRIFALTGTLDAPRVE
jgi:hypothetical protein